MLKNGAREKGLQKKQVNRCLTNSPAIYIKYNKYTLVYILHILRSHIFKSTDSEFLQYKSMSQKMSSC